MLYKDVKRVAESELGQLGGPNTVISGGRYYEIYGLDGENYNIRLRILPEQKLFSRLENKTVDTLEIFYGVSTEGIRNLDEYIKKKVIRDYPHLDERLSYPGCRLFENRLTEENIIIVVSEVKSAKKRISKIIDRALASQKIDDFNFFEKIDVNF